MSGTARDWNGRATIIRVKTNAVKTNAGANGPEAVVSLAPEFPASENGSRHGG